MILLNDNNIKNWGFFGWKLTIFVCESEQETLTKHSEDGQFKYLRHTLNWIIDFLLSLVMSFVGSRLKILRMSWYTIIIIFWTNLELIIKKYLCRLHDALPGVDYSSNIQMLSGISTQMFSYNYISIWFEFI